MPKNCFCFLLVLLLLLLPLPLLLLSLLLLLFYLSSLAQPRICFSPAACPLPLDTFVPLSLCPSLPLSLAPSVPFVPLSLAPSVPLSLCPSNLQIPYTLRPYTLRMIHLEIFAMRALETIFMIGMAGSAVVVLISFVEDFRVLFERDRPRTASERPSRSDQQYSQPADSRRNEPGAAASRA
jgi:hypothetical protein